jgi:hypothetical protein
MAYTINLTDGTIFAVVADGTINTDSSQTLVGKNYAGYGEFLNENFIRMLENASNTSAPGAPLQGQLWYDQTNNIIKVYNGTVFKTLSGATASTSTPTSNVSGDLWFDTTNDQLKAYNGSSFITIGPASTSGQGTSGAIVTTITDNVASDHVVVQMYANSVIVGIWSKDPTFTPGASISGFATIGPGLNMSTTVSNAVFNGTATNADKLDTLDSLSFMRSDAATSNNTSISILADTGLYVGGDSDGRVYVSGTDVRLENATSDGDLVLRVNDGGVTTTAITIDGATSIVNIPTSLVTTGNITGGNLITAGALSSASYIATGNITGGNLNTGAQVVATGNVTGGNLNTGGKVVATGAVQGGSLTDGTLTITSGTITSGVAATFSGNVTGGNLNTGAQVVATGNITGGNVTTAGIVTVNSGDAVTAIINGGTDGVGNIGSSSKGFNTIHALATSAQYADMAERFHADDEYAPGTIVELGGVNEITLCQDDLSNTVFGVVSTKAAYLMNGGAGTNATHPPIAMSGRVPVNVMGFITKGDRLVSAGNGVARSANLDEATAFNVIGRALESKTDEGLGSVEAIVKIV